jgi:hypothetical protein
MNPTVPTDPTAPETPGAGPGPGPEAARDTALRQALHATLHDNGAGIDEQARLAALHTRWMADWAHGVGVAASVPDAVPDRQPAAAPGAARHRATSRRRVATLGIAGGPGRDPRARAPRWLGGLGVAIALAGAFLLWQQRQNELALDELSQVDVLSQMAAGEM